MILGSLIAVYLIAVLFGLHPSWPTDYLLNIGSTPYHEELSAEPHSLVVLQHGLWRSEMSLWRLERTLLSHGYAVLNPSYPSTRGSIEEHADRLKSHIDEYVADHGKPAHLHFVSHSMGGLVIRRYQSLAESFPGESFIFIGVPHRGAQLCDLRKEFFLFPMVMGKKAAMQLSPSDPFYDALQVLDEVPVGTIIGGLGDQVGFHDGIEGDDDGTVAVSEAHCPEETDSVLLPLGHTRLTLSRSTLSQVLQFLKTQRFAKE